MPKELKEKLEEIFNKRPQARCLFFRLKKVNELVLFGGAVRDYLEGYIMGDISCYMPRDFDFIIHTNEKGFLENNLKNFKYKRNQFDGYKVWADDLIFDIWHLNNTWAFKKKIVKESVANLKKTVFLNIDDAVYDVHKEVFYNGGYNVAKAKRELDVVLEKNPCVELNLVRALYLKKKYNLRLSIKLKKIIINKMLYYDEFIEFIDKLYKEQCKHYGQEKLTYSDIKMELKKITESLGSM